MANLSGTRIRDNGVFGTITDNPLTVGAVTFNSADLADLSVVAGNHAIVTLDPLREFGDPEIIMITAHTAAATVATIQRGMFGTVARQHTQGTLWVHAATNDDFIRIVTSATRPADQFEGQFIYETDTNKLVGFGGTDWAPRDAGGTLGYAQVVAVQNFTTIVDATGLSLTVTASTGRRLKTSFEGGIFSSVANDIVAIYITDGSNTQLQEGKVITTTNAHATKLTAAYVETPSAGSITRKIRLERAQGTGTCSLRAAATAPAYIIIEDIGAA